MKTNSEKTILERFPLDLWDQRGDCAVWAVALTGSQFTCQLLHYQAGNFSHRAANDWGVVALTLNRKRNKTRGVSSVPFQKLQASFMINFSASTKHGCRLGGGGGDYGRIKAKSVRASTDVLLVSSRSFSGALTGLRTGRFVALWSRTRVIFAGRKSRRTESGGCICKSCAWLLWWSPKVADLRDSL